MISAKGQPVRQGPSSARRTRVLVALTRRPPVPVPHSPHRWTSRLTLRQLGVHGQGPAHGDGARRRGAGLHRPALAPVGAGGKQGRMGRLWRGAAGGANWLSCLSTQMGVSSVSQDGTQRRRGRGRTPQLCAVATATQLGTWVPVSAPASPPALMPRPACAPGVDPVLVQRRQVPAECGPLHGPQGASSLSTIRSGSSRNGAGGWWLVQQQKWGCGEGLAAGGWLRQPLWRALTGDKCFCIVPCHPEDPLNVLWSHSRD